LACSQPEPCDVPFDMNKGRSRAPATSTHPSRWESEESSPVRAERRMEHLDFTSVMTQLYMGIIIRYGTVSPSSFVFYHIGKQAP
jgi:hypothetical protein